MRAGNGSQWSKMGEPLLHSSPAFRRAVHACAAALKPHGLDLLAEFGKEEGWKHPSLAMVGLVAVQVHTRMLRLPDVLLSSQPTISRTFDAESLDVI